MIFFDNISKIYNHASVALRNITLRIEPKEFVSVVGSSGSGKTTLLKLLIREEDPTEGSIFLDGMEVSAVAHRDLHHVRRRIGTVFQDYKLLPTKTAAENVAFAMRPQVGETRRLKRMCRRFWSSWGSMTKWIISRTSSPAAKNSAWRLPGRSSIARR